MHQSHFSQFEQSVNKLGIELAINVSEDTRARTSPALPDRWYKVLHNLGVTLSLDREGVLATQDIPLYLIGEDPSFAAEASLSIINQSRHRNFEVSQSRSFRNYNPPKKPACGEAEGYFAQTFSFMRYPNRVDKHGPNASRGWTIITDQNEAIGVQKIRGGARTVLGLVDLSVDGITFPPGSLYAARMPPKTRRTKYERLKVAGAALQNLSFIRLSAWSIPADAREHDFQSLLALHQDNILSTWSIGELKSLASRAIKRSFEP